MLRLISTSRLTRSSGSSAPQAKQYPKLNFLNSKSLQVSQVNFTSKRFYAANRIYVGNVPWTTTENELRDLFAEFGKVSEVKIPTDRETGRAKGFAFITMETNEAGSSAVSQLDGKAFGGRTLRVNEAREREAGFGGSGPRTTGGGGGGGFNNNRPPRRSFNDSNEQ
jgi:RNA recognition motif-containing protein